MVMVMDGKVVWWWCGDGWEGGGGRGAVTWLLPQPSWNTTQVPLWSQQCSEKPSVYRPGKPSTGMDIKEKNPLPPHPLFLLPLRLFPPLALMTGTTRPYPHTLTTLPAPTHSPYFHTLTTPPHTHTSTHTTHSPHLHTPTTPPHTHHTFFWHLHNFNNCAHSFSKPVDLLIHENQS